MTGLELIHEHYLKRELLRLQIDYEVEELDDFKKVGRLGPPFQPEGEKDSCHGEFPILYHMFDKCIKKFPFLDDVDDKQFWRDTVQVFLDDFASKEISNSVDRSEITKRYRMGVRFKKMIQLYTASGIKTTTNESEAKVPRVSERGLEPAKVDLHERKYINGYQINVAGVRHVRTKRRNLLGLNSGESVHAEFLIKAETNKVNDFPAVFVARRYSDFKELDKRLHKEFPGKPLPSLPSKNKSDAVMTSEVEESLTDEDDKSDIDSNSVLKRERQRTSFRGYIRQLVENPQVARSQTFLEFLFRDKISELTPEELEDIRQREHMDRVRMSHQIRFFEIATSRARALEGFITEFKQDLLAKNGIEKLFSEVKHRDSIQDLSPKFQKFVEWAVIETAATLYHIFVADDTSPEFFSQIKRIHNMLPYTVLRGILRYTNPVRMIKGVTDLFLAQPFGKRSLLQNIFWIVLGDDIKTQEKLLTELRDKINYPEVTTVIDAYIVTDAGTKNYIRQCAVDKNVDLVQEVFDNSKLIYGESGKIGYNIKQLVGAWHEEWQNQASSQDHEAVDMYAQLREYLKLGIRKRDKDKMQEFWSDDSTLKMIRELVTVFYTPLIKVFKLANMHESVGDFQRFMDDLIKVVDRAESEAASSDPNQLVEQFVALCTVHQGSVFKFIHQVYQKDDGLFGALMKWISNIIEFLREGNGNLMDVQGVFAQAREDPTIDTDLVVREMDDIIKWIKDRREWRDKVAARAAPGAEEDGNQDWSQAMPTQGIKGSDFGLDDDELQDFQEDEYEVTDVKELEAPPRPEVSESVKLRPIFAKELARCI